jgi:Cu/Ag efflux protein CusF
MATIQRVLAAFAILAIGTTAAAAQQSANIRGTIAAFDGKTLTVAARDGGTVAVDLPDTVNVAITKPFKLSDITPGMALGVTTVRRGDQVIAIDVRPIPATANMGLTPYDLQPESTMTNATFEGAAQVANGNEIALNYRSGTVKALVVPGTAMSQAAPGTRADLKIGEAVFVAARREADGRIAVLRVQVGKDGVAPTQ